MPAKIKLSSFLSSLIPNVSVVGVKPTTPDRLTRAERRASLKLMNCENTTKEKIGNIVFKEDVNKKGIPQLSFHRNHTNRIAHIAIFITSLVELWLEREIALTL